MKVDNLINRFFQYFLITNNRSRHGIMKLLSKQMDSAHQRIGFTKKMNFLKKKNILNFHTKDELEHSAEVLEQMKAKK